ncbi:MAG: zinc ribbon domain-containing protein [Spirochaetaceae bacterium]|jgi:RNA polymerase subunit RPABC4/transcription elongation factor Spt4|nr:zinc ribbon domain-containing protein [Spirochaetaceae bacterium]
MKYCRLCGQELPEEAQLCADCGTRQPELEKSNSQAGIYGNCGKPAERDWNLCPFCGAALAVPDAPKKVGLYAGGAYQGPLELLDALKWIVMNAEDGGNYRVVLGKDEAVPYFNFEYAGKRVTVSLQGDGYERTVRGEVPINKPMFAVHSGATFTLEAGVTLEVSNSPVVAVAKGGNFIMIGGSISGNSAFIDGGGVSVYEGGTFIMKGGSISGNSAGYRGGGVFVSENGNFTMKGGSISGNLAGYNGGGVFVQKDGIFFKSVKGGVIYGSNAPEGQANKAKTGAAVYCYEGKKYRDTTARDETVIDTRMDGVAGGWV